MAHPIFKNVHFETILFYPVPQGITVTIRPGEYVQGKCFEIRVKRGIFEEVIDIEEIKRIPARSLKYKQR